MRKAEEMRIQYLGFNVLAGGREYNFLVTVQDEADRTFTVTINQAGFLLGGLKYQEGPDISYRKLRGMLAVEHTDSPPGLRQLVTESDISGYAVMGSGSAKTRKRTEEQRMAAQQRFRERLG
jgi:hypothetical protein